MATGRAVAAECHIRQHDMPARASPACRAGYEQSATQARAATAATDAIAAVASDGVKIVEGEVFNRDGPLINEEPALIVGGPGRLVFAFERRVVAADDVERHAAFQVDRLKRAGNGDTARDVDFEMRGAGRGGRRAVGRDDQRVEAGEIGCGADGGLDAVDQGRRGEAA